MDENKQNDIRELGTVETTGPIKIISVIGQIEGHTELPPQSKATKYEHIIPMILDVELNDSIKGMLLIMNTMGGDVEAGLAIAELVASMRKPTVSLVLGGGHSIGVPLAVSAGYSFITQTASMTVHPIRTTGLFINTPQSFRYYENMQDRVIRFVAGHARIDEVEVRRLMHNTEQLADDTGTVLIGAQAVEAGLIDAVGGLKDALARLYALIGVSF